MVQKAFRLFITQQQAVQQMLLSSMQMVAEQAAGAKAPTQINGYSAHALEQFARRDGALALPSLPSMAPGRSL